MSSLSPSPPPPEAAAPPWRPLLPPNERGESLCGRLVPASIPGVALGWREEYAWLDKHGRVLRTADPG